MTTLQQVIDQNLQIPYGDLASSPLATDQQLCREVQECLHPTYYNFTIDGIYGGITRAALREFKEEKGLTGGDILGPTTAKFLLREPVTGTGLLPPAFGSGRDNLAQAVIKEGRRRGLTLRTQIAYIMATVEHEVAGTYRPIREFGGPSKWYAPYYGRGYVQLTHRSNYQKYSNILGIDLVGNPDRALEPQIALFVLVHGMANGTFTGRRLGQYVNVNHTDFYNARRVVNWIDRAQHIANLANQWLSRLPSLEAAAPEMAAPEAAAPEFIDETTELSEEERLMLEQVMSS
jgi:peptidoglycan hydrolase-like protein with peptidoglycan-binding domain